MALGSNSKLPIIDVWAQPALKQFFKYVPELADLLIKLGQKPIVEKGISPEDTIQMMDEAGIATVLLSAHHRPGQWVISNDEIAAIVQQFPDRFVGVAAVNLDKPVEAVHELERAVKELGFKALRVVPWLWNRPPNDKLCFPLYVKCIELGIPFCTQVGHTGPLMPSEPGRPVPYLDEVALTFPELKIVAGHIGYPWTDEMIAMAWKHENVFIDTSAHWPRYYPPELVHYLKTYGKDKVLFATDFPVLPFAKCVAQVDQLDLPEDVRGRFLYRNAQQVFDLKKS